MGTRLRLLAAALHYEPDIRVSTAVSTIDAVHSLYLLIERDDGFRGIGEVRANITFLSKLPEDRVAPAIRVLAEALSWSAEPEALLEGLPEAAAGHPNIARAAVESALIDGVARAAGVTVAERLGGAWSGAVRTNQCLFWSEDAVFDRLAERYVAEGFKELKVRVAIADFAQDLARLNRLRERFGQAIEIAIDANGAWSADAALERLHQLAPLGLAYVEQPTPVGDWEAFRRVGEAVAVPLMMDEGLTSAADIDRLARLGPPFLAHLKIVKLGGPMAVMAAGRRLAEAGVGVMMGQMNEGAMSTALAVHCASALEPRYAELYGCYGLVDDPSTGLWFENGTAAVADRPGTGIEFDEMSTRQIWEVTQ